MSALGSLDPQQVEPLVQLAFLLALRLLPLVLLFPLFLGELADIPLLARAMLLLLLTVCLMPAAQAHAHSLPVASTALLPLCVRELVLGLLYAVALSLPMHAARWAGELMEGVRDNAPPRDGPLGRFYLLLAVAVFVAIGGHRLTLRVLADTLKQTPLGAPALDASLFALATGSAELLGHAIVTALLLAAPVLIAVLATDLFSGLAARVAGAPQLLGLQAALRPFLLVAVALLSLYGVIAGLERAYVNVFNHLGQAQP